MQKIGDIPNTRADSHGEFTDGNVAGGVPPTILPAEWFNTLQRELIKVVQAGGLTLDPNDDTQVLAALKKLFLQSGNNLSEIKAAGPAAVAAALANLGALSTTGTAIAATKLSTARKIGGVAFDGTADITLPFINTTSADIQLAGNLGVKNLEVHPMPNSSEGGQIDLYDKNNARAAFVDIDTTGNFRVVVEELGVALFVSKANRDVSMGAALSVAGDVRSGGGKSWLAADGNIYGSIWGGYLSTYLSNRLEHRVRAWAVIQGNGTIISSFGFAAINRTNVGGYNLTMSTSNGAYAVSVGINGGSQNGGLSAHSANIWNRSPNSFSIQNANDSGTQYNWIDWPEFYVIVVGP